MFVLAIYDVNTTEHAGQRRLRKVAKVCERYGQRVQNSSFECNVDASQYELLKHELAEIIDQKHDSIRFYRLGNSYKSKIEHLGITNSFAENDLLIF